MKGEERKQTKTTPKINRHLLRNESLMLSGPIWRFFLLLKWFIGRGSEVVSQCLDLNIPKLVWVITSWSNTWKSSFFYTWSWWIKINILITSHVINERPPFLSYLSHISIPFLPHRSFDLWPNLCSTTPATANRHSSLFFTICARIENGPRTHVANYDVCRKMLQTKMNCALITHTKSLQCINRRTSIGRNSSNAGLIKFS